MEGHFSYIFAVKIVVAWEDKRNEKDAGDGALKKNKSVFWHKQQND